MIGKPRTLNLSPTRLINSIKHEHSCKILYFIDFDNLTQMHTFIESAQNVFLPSMALGIYHKFYRKLASTKKIMKCLYHPTD